MDSNEIINEVPVSADTVEALTAKKEMKKAGVFFFVLLLMEIPLSLVVSCFRAMISSDYYYLVSILITQGYLLICAILFMVITKKRFTVDLQLKKYKLSTFFLSFVVLLTASPMATVLNLISQFFAKNNTGLAILQVSEQLPVWLGVIVVGCLPGFIEETLYRGIMYQAFRRRSILTGIIISAVSFGVMHMNFNQMLYAIYLGVIFALLLEATGSLGSTMILHMVFNGMNTLYLYVLPVLLKFMSGYSQDVAKMYLDEQGNVDMSGIFNTTPSNAQLFASLALYLPMAVGGLVLTILLLKAIAKINGRNFSLKYMMGDIRITSVVRPVTVCLVLGWIFCIVNAVMELFVS